MKTRSKKDSRLSIIITIIVIFKYNYNSEEPNIRGIINMQRIIIVDVNSKKKNRLLVL